MDTEKRQQYDMDNRVNPMKASQAWMEWLMKKRKAFDQRGDMAVAAWAELDCSLLSLECCKEEKQKLEDLLQECKEERAKMSEELESMRELVQSCSSHENIQMQEHDTLADKSISAVPPNNFLNPEQREGASNVPTVGTTSPRPKIQAAIQSRGVNGNGNQLPSEETTELDKSEESLALINDNFRAETLRSSLDHLKQ